VASVPVQTVAPAIGALLTESVTLPPMEPGFGTRAKFCVVVAPVATTTLVADCVVYPVADDVTWYDPGATLLNVYVPLPAVVLLVLPHVPAVLVQTVAPPIGRPVTESVTVPLMAPGVVGDPNAPDHH
jgi:hypothetical protein